MPALPKGLVPAAYSPFADDGNLDIDRVPALAQRFIDDGIEGTFVVGTTGEFASLSHVERLELQSAWCREAPDALQVIVHVGGTSLPECRALASRAQQDGAAAIASIGPYFFRPASLEDLVTWCAAIASAAPELPFLYYHLPSLTRVDFSMADWISLAADRIPNFAGIKYTHLDPDDLIRALAFDDRLALYYGSDETLLTGLSLGVHGAVGTTYQLMAPLFQSIMRDFEAGRIVESRAQQLQATKIIQVFKNFGGHPAMKEVLKWTGVDCGEVRLPLRALNSQEKAELRSEIDQLGFFDVCSGA